MGKFKISYSASFLLTYSGTACLNKGISFELLSQVISSIPEGTFVIGVSENVSYGTIEIECENYNFLNGTVVIPRYKTVTNTLPMGINTYNVFDGIDIMEPSIQQPSPGLGSTIPVATKTPLAAIKSTIFGTIPVPATVYSICDGSGSISCNGFTVSAKDIKTLVPKCSCGAASVGGIHSNYCDIK